MIEVVSAIIARDGRLLMIQRSPTKSEFPLGWESPGGKVEAGETHHEALKRELKEELGIEATEIAKDPIFSRNMFKILTGCKSDFNSSFYAVEKFSGDIKLVENQSGFGWFTPEEFVHLALLPANEAAFHAIRRYVRGEPA